MFKKSKRLVKGVVSGVKSTIGAVKGGANYLRYGTTYGDINKIVETYRTKAHELGSSIKDLDYMSAQKKVELAEYRRRRSITAAHYQDLVEIAEELQNTYRGLNDESKKKEVKQDLAKAIKTLDEFRKEYGNYIMDIKNKYDIPIGISSLEPEEKAALKEGRKEGRLEKKVKAAEKAIASFLLISASASFGFALLNTTAGITGAAIGISSSYQPSLLLSTLALIIIIWVVSPSDYFNK